MACEGWEYVSEELLMAKEVEPCVMEECVTNCEEQQRRPPGKQDRNKDIETVVAFIEISNLISKSK